MSRLEKIYEAMILEHNRNPRQFYELESCTHSSHGKNPLCGDDFFVYLVIENDEIKDISFKGVGCAISKSSGSLMVSHLKGKKVSAALTLKDDFLDLVTTVTNDSQKENLGKLRVFEGVQKFPIRVKCAALVWRTLENALLQSSGDISTE
jgi:nitrogen fixation protein NifU and related proteins